jgi:integrase
VGQVQIEGKRRSKVFPTKREAVEWEVAIRKQPPKPGSGKTVEDVMVRYQKEVTPTKRGYRREYFAISRILADRDFSCVPLEELGPRHVAEWRDRRLRQVTGSSVDREMNVISNALQIARKEWEWLDREITKDVRRPTKNPPRTRMPTELEIAAVIYTLGDRGVSGRVSKAFQFALETGLRCGEICNLRPEDRSGSVIIVRESKTEAGRGRQVPLSVRAREILDDLSGEFNLNSSQVSALFRKALKRAGIEDLHFHDARRYFLTNAAKKVDIVLLAKIAGHKDLQMLRDVYYCPDMSEVADVL